MSYNVTLRCGCVVYVARNPATGEAHTRVIESRAADCFVRHHDVGARLEVWELLADTQYWAQLGAVKPPKTRSYRA